MASINTGSEQSGFHYGDPFAEQRMLAEGAALVDLSYMAVVTVCGPDRLSWLNDLTTAQLLGLGSGESRMALVLDHNGRVLHELRLVDDGECTWLLLDSSDLADVVAYLESMKFLLRVEIVDRSEEFAVVGSVGAHDINHITADVAWTAPAEFAGTGETPSGEDRGGGATKYVPVRPGVFPEVQYVVRRDALPDVLAGAANLAGTWAWEALRVKAAVPRAHADTDDRTLPNEVGWIGPAVHLQKGCYRGQEAVARTHNMGRPPRRLTKLLLADGDDLPQQGAEITLDGRRVGKLGTVASHFDEGPIALALLRGRVPVDAALLVAGASATQIPVVVT